MTVHINLIVQDTPDGVTVQAYGPLHDSTEAAFVARALLRLAEPIFAGGRPVRLVGDLAKILVPTEPAADPIAQPDPEPASAEFCTCSNELTTQEIETLHCQTCGKGLLTWMRI